MVSTNLEIYLQESYKAVQGLLTGFPVNYNPHEMRIAPLLKEQETMLSKALFLLQQNPWDQKEFRKTISIIYRNNEAFDPIFRGWLRASKWMGSAPPETLRLKKQLSRYLRHQLILAVPSIQSLYGEEDSRYIIPPLYRYEIKLLN